MKKRVEDAVVVVMRARASQSVGRASERERQGDHTNVRSDSPLPLVHYFTSFVGDSLARFREIPARSLRWIL